MAKQPALNRYIAAVLGLERLRRIQVRKDFAMVLLFRPVPFQECLQFRIERSIGALVVDQVNLTSESMMALQRKSAS